jgi:adsorption protein B
MDRLVTVSILPLSTYIVLSGLDDLFIDVVWGIEWVKARWRGRRRVKLPSASDLTSLAEKQIAIFIPLWHESSVVEEMVAHSVAAIRYRNYVVIAGAYPNDEATLRAVRDCQKRYPNVHLAICPHDGPTSKADCLNWIYRRMLEYETNTGARFDLVVTHDAEDLIHPDSLSWINYYAEHYDFVQIPVLPLRTDWQDWTHGVYCDEFAEFQSRDLPVRHALGGFIPSAGVGTAYSRRALEALSEYGANCIFEPACLTEDYETGYQLHTLGFAQVFVPPLRTGAERSIVATREYFPRKMHAAIRQRTRWVTGIALQAWERHGWCGGFRQAYWFWRDRKGLVGNPLSLFANLLLIYTTLSGFWFRATLPESAFPLLISTFVLCFVRVALRAVYVTYIYDWRTAAMTSVRTIFANGINCLATCRAIWRYTATRLRGAQLVWLKTDHAYPARSARAEYRRRIGDILVATGVLSERQLRSALETQPEGIRIGEHLIASGLITESQLYMALSVQHGLPLAASEIRATTTAVFRALPLSVVRQWRVVPFKISEGKLHLATPEPPPETLGAAIRQYTAMELRYHLIPPTAFRQLQAGLLGESLSGD